MSRAEDLLDRAGLAALLADEVQSLNASQGAVVGVLGDWGSGKTSLLNMLVEQLKDSSIPVVEFNPWLFSGTEQLVTAFFEELAAQLRLKGDRLGSIAEKLEMYGDSLSPLRFIPMLGPWLDRAGVLVRRSVGCWVNAPRGGGVCRRFGSLLPRS
jgi:energy-coupling factor transporter ATP-binding protein EcfA2